ncbi:MAG TPA: hypothetical protein VEW48_07270 [Thermoanaerobaculia bacterium]|nr:hypothetical protein [Thermoanaerobaculia bacterium]
MRAIKLNTHVAGDRTLRLKLPDDVEEGPAEVIVLVADAPGRRSHTLQDFLVDLSSHPRHIRTREEIDRYLEQERESWD